MKRKLAILLVFGLSLANLMPAWAQTTLDDYSALPFEKVCTMRKGHHCMPFGENIYGFGYYCQPQCTDILAERRGCFMGRNHRYGNCGLHIPFCQEGIYFYQDGKPISESAKAEWKDAALYIPLETLEQFWSHADAAGEAEIFGTIDIPKEKAEAI